MVEDLELSWEQKLLAIQALGVDVSLKMRKPGDWYVDVPETHISDGATESTVIGDGDSPEDAVEATWDSLTELDSEHYVFLRSVGHERSLRWNGFMWADFEPGP